MTKKIPKGLCQCGCGKTTAIATRNRNNLGWVKGEPLRYLRGHNNLAERGPETPWGRGAQPLGLSEKSGDSQQ